MTYFVTNCITLGYLFFTWFLSGLGVCLLLLPRYKYRDICLLSPIIGVCLLAIIGLFQITVLRIPLAPILNIVTLIMFSLITCFWIKRRHFIYAWKKCRIYWLLVICPILVMLFIFAWLFQNTGFHLLVGSSDQLQYAENARHINEEMHTGSARDIPIPRQHYFVYEGVTRVLPYDKNYRRGAEVILASSKAITKLSYSDVFPVVIFCSLATLSLVLAFIGRTLFGFTLFYTLLTQFLFLSSFYFLTLHIQGSLALTLSIAPELVALSLFTFLIRRFSWKWFFLQAILLCGFFVMYSESALISMLIPCVFLIGFELWRSKRKGVMLLKHMILLYVLIAVVAPFSIYSIIKVTGGNLLVVYYQLLASFSHNTVSILTTNVDSIWNPIAVVLGLMSYYDPGTMNYHIATFLGKNPKIIEGVFLILALFACIGFLRVRNIASLLFALILMLWTISSLVMFHSHDTLRLVRSVQYAMPFILLGLVVLCNDLPFYKKILRENFLPWIGRVLLLLFIGINVSTSARTLAYVNSHDISNDTIILRYSEKAAFWESLRQELHLSAVHHVPVLFAGFKETIKPFAISIALRDQPHMLGNSISSFWQIYSSFQYPLDVSMLCFDNDLSMQPFELFSPYPRKKVFNMFCRSYSQYVESMLFKNLYAFSWHASNDVEIFLKRLENSQAPQIILPPLETYNARVRKDIYLSRQLRENQPWLLLEPYLLGLTEQAIVPVGFGYPEEWKDTRDVFAVRVKRFPPMCDIIARNDFVVTLKSDVVSSIKHDISGPYRNILKSGSLQITEHSNLTHVLSLIVEGNENDVTLNVGSRHIRGTSLSNHGHLKLETKISPGEINHVNIMVKRPIKLRSIEWNIV